MGKLGDYLKGQSAHLVNDGLRHRQGNRLVHQRLKDWQIPWSTNVQINFSKCGGPPRVRTLSSPSAAHHLNSREGAATAQRAAA
jgi:hypothetical protein